MSAYNIEDLKKLCNTSTLDYQDFMSKSYRVKVKTKENQTEEKNIRILSIPFDKDKEKVVFNMLGVEEDKANAFYTNLAIRIQNTREIHSKLKNKATLVTHIVFDEESLNESISKSEHNIYCVRTPVSPATQSLYINDNKTHLGAILRIGANLVEAAFLLANEGYHIGSASLDNIVVDARNNILIDSLLFSDKESNKDSFLTQIFPKNTHESVFATGNLSFKTDVYAIIAMLWNILSGKSGSDQPDLTVKPGYAPENVVSLLEKGLAQNVDENYIKELYDATAEIENDSKKNVFFTLGEPPQKKSKGKSKKDGKEGKGKEPEKNIAPAAAAAAGAASILTLPNSGESTPKGKDTKGKPSDPAPESEQAEPKEEEPENENTPEPETGKKKSPFSKLKNRKEGKEKKNKDGKKGKKDNTAAITPDGQNDAPQVPEGAQVQKVFKKKDDGKGKKKFSLDDLKKKQVLLPTLAGILVVAIVAGNLWATPDAMEEPVAEDEESSFVTVDSRDNDDDDDTHYSTIEKADEEDEDDSSVPSSSTYSGDDDEDDSSSSSTDSDSSSSSSSSGSSGSSGASSGSTSSGNTSSSSGSGSSSGTTSSTSSSSSNRGSSSTSTYRPSTSNSNSSSSGSSSKPSTSKPATSTTTTTTTPSTTQPSEPAKPVVKPNTTLSVTPNTATIKVGESVEITPTMTCVFSSDSAHVAVVEDGRIIGKGAGTCTVTAKGLDGQTYNISVTVTES